MQRIACLLLAGPILLLAAARAVPEEAASEATALEAAIPEAAIPGIRLPEGPREAPGAAAAREARTRLESAFVTVEGEYGEGGGTIVGEEGLVLTRANGLMPDAPNVVVRFPGGERRAGGVLTIDRESGLAVVRFHPEGVRGWTVVPVGGGRVVPAQRVFSPACGVSLASIYKTEPGIVLFDKVLGCSPVGLPLLTLAGEMIGLCVPAPPGAPRGGDVWGYRPMQAAAGPLALARERAASVPLPSPEPLPALSTVPVPADVLQEAFRMRHEPVRVGAPKNLDAHILTPFSMLSEVGRPPDCAQMRNHIVGAGGVFSYMAGMGLCLTDLVVTVEVTPAMKETARSKWVRAITPFFAPRQIAPNLDARKAPLWEVPDVAAEREFRDGFLDLQLLRGGAPVMPVRRIRFVVSGFGDTEATPPATNAVGGAYAFDPGAFRPDVSLVLRYRKTSDPQRWYEIPISEAAQRGIWNEFASWRVAALSMP